jgi:hypothetical protein
MYEVTMPKTFDDGIPKFLKRKLPKGWKPAAYVPPKEREIVTRYGQAPAPKVEVVLDAEKPKAYKPTIQESIKEKHSTILGEIEGMIDDSVFTEKSPLFVYLRKIKATPRAAKVIAEKLAPQAIELSDVLNNPDDLDLQEGYMKFSTEEVETLYDLYSQMVQDCIDYASVNKTVRKATKKKLPSKEKLLKTFKYQEKDDGFKIASIDPARIIGAVELWTFNTKYKFLTVYRALDRGGLSVKGGSIINFDEKNSFRKGVRKPIDEKIQKVLTGGKVILKNLMDNLTTKPAKVLGSVNKTTILLKVIQ